MERILSVIIPCYNAEKYIEKCLDTIVNQTIGIQNLELIIIDDASTDNSLLCIKKYKEQYPENILIILLEQNAGQANARNIGMRYVTSKYFTFVDADDWLELDAYEKMLMPAIQYKCDLIQCGIIEMIEGKPLHYIPLKNQEKIFYINSVKERKEFFSECRLPGMIGISVYRTEWIRTENIEFKSFPKYEDNYWGGLIAYSFHSYYAISDCLYYYRLLDHSNSHERNDESHFVRLEVELEKLNYYMQTGLFHTYYEEIRNNFLDVFYVNTIHIICCKFDYIPLEFIHIMQKTIQELYPDYLEYYKENSGKVFSLLTIPYDFSSEMWEKYKSAYLNFIINGKQDEIAQICIQLKNGLRLE